MTAIVSALPDRSTVRGRVCAEIRAEMGRAGISGVKLANKIGWTQPYFSRRMSGKLAFDVDDLERIADALGVPLWRLVTSRPSVSQPPPEDGSLPWPDSNRQPFDYKINVSPVVDIAHWRTTRRDDLVKSA